MIVTIKNDDGEVIKEVKLDSLVGVGFVKIPNIDEEGICTLVEEAGTPQIAYATKFLDVFMNKKLETLIQNSRPAKDAFEEWMKDPD